MNATNTVVRSAAGLLALCGMLGLTCQSAHADLAISAVRDPAHAQGVRQYETALQFEVVNTSSSTANNQKISVILNTRSIPTDYVFFQSAAFSVPAQTIKWITVDVPEYGAYGTKLIGRSLLGFGKLGQAGIGLNFTDTYPAPDVEFTAVQADSNGKGFTVTLTNEGNLVSSAETLKVTLYQYADGQIGPKFFQQSVPVSALQPGYMQSNSRFMHHFAVPAHGFQLQGTVEFGTPGHSGYRSVEVSL